MQYARAIEDAAFLSRLSHSLGLLGDPAEISRLACAQTGEHLGAARCYFAGFDEAAGEATVSDDWCREDLASLAGAYRMSDFLPQEMWGEVAAGGLAVADIRADPRLEAYVPACERIGVRSFASFPFVREGRWVAALAVAATEPRAWSREDVALLGSVVARVWPLVERARSEQALRESEQRLRLVHQAAGVGAWEWSSATNEVFWSPEYREIYGLEPGEPPSFERGIGAVLEEDREGVVRAVSRALETGEEYRSEHRIRHPKNGLRWIQAIGRTVSAGRGPVRMVGIVIDVTERKHAETALREADRRKEEFLATLSHELRGPLAPLLNAVAILERPGIAPAQAQRALEILRRQTGQLSHLVDDLLDVSRINRGSLALRRERFRLAEALEAAIEMSRPRLEARRHAFAAEIADGDLRVDGDRSRLAQVFANLLDNAAKFSGPGGNIAVSMRREGGWAVVAVRDDGRGIEPELVPRLFGMFVRGVEANEGPEGLGIGLSLVRHLVEIHSGSVEARSEGPGRGSEFTVRLPVSDGG